MRRLLSVGLLSGVALAGACGESSKGSGSKDQGGAPSAGDGGQAPEGPGGAGDNAGGGSITPSPGGAGAGGVDNTPGGASPGGTSPGGSSVGGAAGGAAGGEGGAGGALTGAVSGRVISKMEGVADVTVVIDGVVTSTDANGYFTVPDVDASYQAIMINAGEKVAQVMDDLSTRSLVVQLVGASDTREAAVAGKLSGGAGFPSPAGHQSEVDFVCDDCNGAGFDIAPDGAAYKMNVAWGGAATAPGMLYGLQWKADQSGPLDFTGFASKQLTLTDGGTFGDANGSVAATNLDLVNVTERSLTGTISAPASLTTVSSDLLIGPYQLSFEATTTSYTTVVPTGLTVPCSLNVTLSASDASSSRRARVPANGNLNLIFPTVPVSTLPQANATGVDSNTSFTWTSATGGVDYVTFQIEAWTIYRYSREGSTTLPDLSDYGVTLTPGATGTWYVTFEGPADSVDDAIAIEKVLYGHGWEVEDLSSSSGASREFELAQ
jgi:hypothetical protein